MSFRIFSFFAAGILLMVARPAPAQTTVTVNGTIVDSASGEPVPSVNIRIAGTAQGTIANAHGAFRIPVPEAHRTLIFSAIGYAPREIAIPVPPVEPLLVRLTSSPVIVPEVLVIAEDPAFEIIRKAIAHKRSWMGKLTSYQFEAFTRQTLLRDTSIASITESYTTGFMATGDTLREIVRQKRQTQNIPMGDNGAAVRSIVNFNEDEIRLFQITVGSNSSAYSFIGPTAPEALEYYDYKLLRTSTVDGVDIYTIRMTPTTNLRPLFDGIITIADGTFAVMGVDVKPNETLNIPFLRDIDLRYRQQFSLYDGLFWMPTDIRISGAFSVSLIGFSLPRIGIEQTSAIYEYRLNDPLPDSMRGRPRVSVDSLAQKYDSTFWKGHDVLPLTEREQSAYGTLDSTQTLEKQFEPKGPLASLGDDEASDLFGILDLRFNRVEGFFTGLTHTTRSLIPNMEFRAKAGYGFSDKRFKYNLGATWSTGRRTGISAGADVYRAVGNTPDGGFYEPFAISVMALFSRIDYRDYYFTTGWSGYIALRPARWSQGTITYTDEQHYSVANATSYSFFGKRAYRDNPSIADGHLRSISLAIRLGDEPVPLGIVSRNAIDAGMEYSSPSVLRSEFDFRRYWALAEFGITTFGRSLLFPPQLRIRLFAGTSAGTLPPQRWQTLDTRASGYGAFGLLRGADVKEFVSRRYLVINAEHNFRSTPFLLLGIPFLYRNGVELIVHGSYAYADGYPQRYGEVGGGISRIFDLFRADVTYRCTGSRGWAFTLGIATLF